jgi:hypothetical protein
VKEGTGGKSIDIIIRLLLYVVVFVYMFERWMFGHVYIYMLLVIQNNIIDFN